MTMLQEIAPSKGHFDSKVWIKRNLISPKPGLSVNLPINYQLKQVRQKFMAYSMISKDCHCRVLFYKAIVVFLINRFCPLYLK